MTIHPSSDNSARGMAIIVVIGLIALILVFMVGNARTLHYLSRNVRLIEEKQTRQLMRAPQTAPHPVSPTNAPPNSTNTPAATDADRP